MGKQLAGNALDFLKVNNPINLTFVLDKKIIK